jgi:guanylate kinase
MKQGHLYIISAPSGAGKTSLVSALVAQTSNLCVSISHTTRAMRHGEQEGINYYFVDVSTFEEKIATGGFLEYAHVFEHYYGTSRTFVEKKLALGIDVILEIDWQGAEKIRALCPFAKSIFIFPPSIAVLRERLEKREQDSAKHIEKRLAGAHLEMSHWKAFDYVVVNDEFEVALADLSAILRTQRLTRESQKALASQLTQTVD